MNPGNRPFCQELATSSSARASFGASLHPLRCGTSLSSEEAIHLVTCLRDFAKRWFDNCRLSKDGAGMGCAVPACYGRSVCTRCKGGTASDQGGRATSPHLLLSIVSGGRSRGCTSRATALPVVTYRP